MIFKNWSFRMFIYTVILNIAVAILVANRIGPLGTYTDQTYERNTLIFGIASFITFTLGIIFLIMSIVKKEDKDYKFYISLIGFSILILFSILSLFIR